LKIEARVIFKQLPPRHSDISDTIKNLKQVSSNSVNLTELLKASGSDKFKSHHYELFYEKWFHPYRHVPNLRMLEIGANEGHSLMAWAQYFSDPSLILGLAYTNNEDKKYNLTLNLRKAVNAFKHPSVAIKYGDQSEKRTLNKLCRRGPFNIIIDDGSHVPRHVIFSFVHLWQCLALGGLYVIEDLETSYWSKAGGSVYRYKLTGAGFGKPPPGNAVEKMKQLIDVLVKRQLGLPELSIVPGDEQLCTIEFGMNTMALRKCTKFELDTIQTIDANKGHVDMPELEQYIKKAKKTNLMNKSKALSYD